MSCQFARFTQFVELYHLVPSAHAPSINTFSLYRQRVRSNSSSSALFFLMAFCVPFFFSGPFFHLLSQALANAASQPHHPFLNTDLPERLSLMAFFWLRRGSWRYEYVCFFCPRGFSSFCALPAILRGLLFGISSALRRRVGFSRDFSSPRPNPPLALIALQDELRPFCGFAP